MAVSQTGKESQGIADAPNGSMHAGSTGISQSRVLAGWHILWEGLSSEIIQALKCWETGKGNASNYSPGCGMAKAGIGVGCSLVKQMGSVPFDVFACVWVLCRRQRSQPISWQCPVVSFPKWVFSQINGQLASSRKLIFQHCWLSSSGLPVKM